jgi:hypothetical protein
MADTFPPLVGSGTCLLPLFQLVLSLRFSKIEGISSSVGKVQVVVDDPNLWRVETRLVLVRGFLCSYLCPV